MALDALVDSNQLDADLTSVANAIRTKGGTSASLAFPAEFVSAIAAIPSGGATKTLTNVLGSNTTFVTGYLSGSNTISAASANKEVTTDYIDISAYAGTTLRPWAEVAGNVPPWVALFFYTSSYGTIGGRLGPIATDSNWTNAGFLHYGNALGTIIAGITVNVPSNAVYIRVSFRTGGNASVCFTDDTSFCSEFFNGNGSVSAVAFADALESDGTAS